MVQKYLMAAVLGASLFTGSSLQAATVVNLDGVTNASLNGANAVTLNLDAGVYNLSFVQGAFTAFTRFSNVSGCNGLGAKCITGFENSARFVVNGTTFLFGDGAASGGMGPQATGGYYATAAQSFAASSAFGTSFSLAAPGSVSFYLFDDNLRDNSGGVSLAVAAVPEPATWMFMLLGMAGIGFTMRRKDKQTLRVRYT